VLGRCKGRNLICAEGDSRVKDNVRLLDDVWAQVHVRVRARVAHDLAHSVVVLVRSVYRVRAKGEVAREPVRLEERFSVQRRRDRGDPYPIVTCDADDRAGHVELNSDEARDGVELRAAVAAEPREVRPVGEARARERCRLELRLRVSCTET